MKRHEALIPLTHDHHHALAQARRLRVAANGTEEERLSASGQFLKFFRDDTVGHFREGEEVVFPLVVEAPEARGPLEQALLDHLRIHSLVRALESEAHEGIPSRAVLVRIAALLETHIRFEEKVVFPLIESVVGETNLDSLNLGPRARADV